MLYKENWQDTKARWAKYWKRESSGRPVMFVVARKPEIEAEFQAAKASGKLPAYESCQGFLTGIPSGLAVRDMEDKYQNAQRMAARYRYFCQTHEFMAESFPNIEADFGPGSVASYLGSDIKFSENTIWFTDCVDEWEGAPELRFDPQNAWWKKHIALVRELVSLSCGDFYVGIPDLMENIDVLASLRGAQNCLYDMIDEPEEVARRIWQVNDVYFEYYDRMYEAVKNEADGGSCYTVFQIWGQGRTCKLQCDFSAMMSPANFRDFIQEPLRAQAKKLDNVLYHLDGPDAIKHMDALMEIDEIDALQWTSGDYGPDGACPQWYEIYDKAKKAGKSLWVKIYNGEFEDWLKNTDALISRYGSDGLFLHFPEMSREQALRLIDHAERLWK